MGLFRKKRTPELGIDISSTAVKLLELKREGSRYRVLSYAVEPLPANAVVEKNIVETEAVAEAIKRAVKRSGSKGRYAAVAVPASAVITKTISMSAGFSESELEEQIELQADQYVPYPLDEVNLDFQVIGPSEEPDEVDILLVASRSENVDSRVGALEEAGLEARVVDVESYAMENAFSLMAGGIAGGGNAVAIVDVGATMTTLTVMSGGKNVYTREQVFGGQQLTEEIMRRYGLSYEEAGMAKRKGGLPDGYEEEVLMPFKEAMAQQVARSLQFFYGSGDHDSVDHILLAGGCAVIPGVSELILQHTGVESSVANPFDTMSVAMGVKSKRLAEDAPALMIACGLALRSFE